MKRNVLLFISLCVVGCVMTYAQQMPGLLQKGKADTQDCKAWVDEQLSEMSLKEKTTVYTHSGSSSDTAK